MPNPRSRRDFLKTGGAALALAAVGPKLFAAEEKVAAALPRRQFLKGIMWGTVDVKGSVVE